MDTDTGGQKGFNGANSKMVTAITVHIIKEESSEGKTCDVRGDRHPRHQTEVDRPHLVHAGKTNDPQGGQDDMRQQGRRRPANKHAGHEQLGGFEGAGVRGRQERVVEESEGNQRHSAHPVNEGEGREKRQCISNKKKYKKSKNKNKKGVSVTASACTPKNGNEVSEEPSVSSEEEKQQW